MGSGILDDKHLAHVPGTAPLVEIDDGWHRGITEIIQRADFVFSGLKHGTGGDKSIILIPQPSNSPRDPLQWPLWRRDFIFFIFSVNSAVIGAWQVMLSPGFSVIADEFQIVYPNN